MSVHFVGMVDSRRWGFGMRGRIWHAGIYSKATTFWLDKLVIEDTAVLTRWYARGGRFFFILRCACQYPIIMYASKRKKSPKNIDHRTICPSCNNTNQYKIPISIEDFAYSCVPKPMTAIDKEYLSRIRIHESFRPISEAGLQYSLHSG